MRLHPRLLRIRLGCSAFVASVRNLPAWIHQTHPSLTIFRLDAVCHPKIPSARPTQPHPAHIHIQHVVCVCVCDPERHRTRSADIFPCHTRSGMRAAHSMLCCAMLPRWYYTQYYTIANDFHSRRESCGDEERRSGEGTNEPTSKHARSTPFKLG